MDLQIRGRTALVTGATGGIGEETARQLLDEGVRVVVSDLDGPGLGGAADRLREHATSVSGELVAALPADTTDTAAVERLVADSETALGVGVDVLVHTVGTTGATGTFDEIDDDGWHRAMEVNFFSGVRLCRALAPAWLYGAGAGSCCWPVRTR